MSDPEHELERTVQSGTPRHPEPFSYDDKYPHYHIDDKTDIQSL